MFPNFAGVSLFRIIGVKDLSKSQLSILNYISKLKYILFCL